MCWRLLLVALCCVQRVGCFVLWPGERLQMITLGGDVTEVADFVSASAADGGPPLFRWPAPLDDTTRDGLNLGITYAYDPRFFEIIMSKFKEQDSLISFFKFVSNETVSAVIQRAFTTWAAHNPNIRFIDVTALCNQTYGGDNGNWENWPEQVVPGSGESRRVCEHAEIIITMFETDGSDSTGARVLPFNAAISRPMGTLNEEAHGGSVSHFVFEYATNLCWYIDATFCAGFYQLKEDGIDVVALMGATLGILFILAALILAFAIFKIFMKFLNVLLASWDKDGDGVDLSDLWKGIKEGGGIKYAFKTMKNMTKDKDNQEHTGDDQKIEVINAVWALVDVFANLQLGRVVIVLFFFAFPPIFYFDVFRPCWDCKDFEAASVHEIGHILGLDHPNMFPDYNIKMDVDNYHCNNVTRPDVVKFAPSELDPDSIMFAFMTHDPRSCLTEDDLNGLNFLYPVCHDRIEKPQCFKSAMNIGTLRLAQGIIGAETIPYLFFLAVKIVCTIFIRSRKKAEKAARMAMKAGMAGVKGGAGLAGKGVSGAVSAGTRNLNRVKSSSKVAPDTGAGSSTPA